MTANKFQDIILKHSRTKIGEGKPEAFQSCVEEVNALCGDAVTVYLVRKAGTVGVRYEVRGCALCAASASIMSEALDGTADADAKRLVDEFVDVFQSERVLSQYGDGIEALFDLKRFPAREKCVLLPWQALKQCMSGD